MHVETASQLTFIKHNLILEHPRLFNLDRKRDIKEVEEEMANEIEDEDELENENELEA